MEVAVEDQMLRYPTGKVVGVVPDRGIVDAACNALEATGVDRGRIEVFGGPNARDEPADAEGTGDGGKSDGVIASVVRTVRTGLGEEATRLQQLNEAIDDGQYIVQVELPDEDDDTRAQEKRAVGNALHDAGASHVAFYGRLAVEELQIGA
jgi:hypothetical protein